MSQSSLLHLAEHSAREAKARREDLRTILFPRAGRPPSERQIAAIRRCLAGWIGEIETALVGPIDDGVEERQVYPRCWRALTASGLLGDDSLLDMAENLLFLSEIHGIGQESGDDGVLAYIGEIAGEENDLTATAARRLLEAHFRLRATPVPSIRELPADMLGLLCWRVVAAHEVMAPGSHERLAPMVAKLLSRHDESRRLMASAEALAHKLLEDGRYLASRPELWPERQGLPLALALLSLAPDMPLFDIVAMAREDGAARLALLLRALGYSRQEAARLIACWLRTLICRLF